MKTLSLLTLLLPFFCYGQKDPCKKIQRNTNENGTIAYKSPDEKNITVIKELSDRGFFALVFHIKLDYSEEVGYGVEITLEDGTVIKDEKARIIYQSDATRISANALSSGEFSSRYIWQTYLKMNEKDVAQFAAKRIVKVRLQSVIKKISAKESERVKAYINCMKSLNQ